MPFEANAEATEAIEPGEETLYFPAMGGDFAMEARPVTSFAAGFDPALRNAVANATALQVVAKLAAIIAAVRRQSAWTASGAPVASRHLDRRQSGDGGLEVMNFASLQMQPQRDAVSVYNDMSFTGLPGA